MVKNKKESATRSGKKNSLRFNPLNVGLFVALVLALVFIGSYQYTNSDSRLEGELGTYIDPRPDPDNVGITYECISQEDCNAQPLGLNPSDPNDYVFAACQKCQNYKCVSASSRDICDLDIREPVRTICNGNNLQEIAYKVYCKEDDGGVIGVPSGSEMICGRISDDILIISSIDCSVLPFYPRGNGMDEECANNGCEVTGAGEAMCLVTAKQSGVSCNNGNGRCVAGSCVPI